MKILYVTTIAGTMRFFENYITELVNRGHTVEIACNTSVSDLSSAYEELNCKVYNIPFSRSPFNTGNIKAYKMLKKLVSDGNYDIVHCHTPIAAAATRLACRKVRKKGTKVFYTAHGFHFYKGAPFKNKLIFYPIEKICSYFTDVLITINKEDYALAQNKLKAKEIAYVAGVGIDVSKYRDVDIDKAVKRMEIGVPNDAYLVISVGELNANKNHETVIKAISGIDNSNIHYVIAGEGELKEYLNNIAKVCGISERVHLLGKRNDIAELFKCADVYVHPSFREGLPVAVMEAMASGLPCVVSDIRGSRDLVKQGDSGIVVAENSVINYQKAIAEILSKNKSEYLDFNTRQVEIYDYTVINKQMLKIYEGE